MKQAFKSLVLVLSILILPSICFGQEPYEDRNYLSSVLGLLENTAPLSESLEDTSEEDNLADLAKQGIVIVNTQIPEIEKLLSDVGGKNMEVIDALKPKRSSFMLNMDQDHGDSKKVLAFYNKILDLSSQAQKSSGNEAVKAYATKLIEILTPVQAGFKTWVDNWKPEVKGGFG